MSFSGSHSQEWHNASFVYYVLERVFLNPLANLRNLCDKPTARRKNIRDLHDIPWKKRNFEPLELEERSETFNEGLMRVTDYSDRLNEGLMKVADYSGRLNEGLMEVVDCSDRLNEVLTRVADCSDRLNGNET